MDKNRYFDQLKPGVRIAFDNTSWYDEGEYVIDSPEWNEYTGASGFKIKSESGRFRYVGKRNWIDFGGYILPDTE